MPASAGRAIDAAGGVSVPIPTARSSSIGATPDLVMAFAAGCRPGGPKTGAVSREGLRRRPAGTGDRARRPETAPAQSTPADAKDPTWRKSVLCGTVPRLPSDPFPLQCRSPLCPEPPPLPPGSPSSSDRGPRPPALGPTAPEFPGSTTSTTAAARPVANSFWRPPTRRTATTCRDRGPAETPSSIRRLPAPGPGTPELPAAGRRRTDHGSRRGAWARTRQEV